MDETSVGGHTPSPAGVNPVSMTPPKKTSESSPLISGESREVRTDSDTNDTPPAECGQCDRDAGDGESLDDRALDPAELILRHQSGVWRYLRMLGCDDSTADDLTQETFLRVLKRDDFVQHNDNATAGYLRRTAYNLLVSRHRKLGRMQTIGEPELLDETWDRWAGKDLTGDAAVEALQNCFQKLTERAQIALRMRFDSSASRVEIGEALGITDHGARNLMQRAKQQLRNCVEEKLQLANEL